LDTLSAHTICFPEHRRRICSFKAHTVGLSPRDYPAGADVHLAHWRLLFGQIGAICQQPGWPLWLSNRHLRSRKANCNVAAAGLVDGCPLKPHHEGRRPSACAGEGEANNSSRSGLPVVTAMRRRRSQIIRTI